ncbi:hypothetical protein [Mucilaginibacter dorajii]|uniref:hypothetical protein n=1 Tax=Mucilaginibacter dorajii TaxID=692994 RepID=UPI0021695130|nr:hypothetical protein [Mucilaginibacter dorajii]MCS3733438.1 hypothetical protein [Mucilaginibacter dorajii]
MASSSLNSIDSLQGLSTLKLTTALPAPAWHRSLPIPTRAGRTVAKSAPEPNFATFIFTGPKKENIEKLNVLPNCELRYAEATLPALFVYTKLFLLTPFCVTVT